MHLGGFNNITTAYGRIVEESVTMQALYGLYPYNENQYKCKGKGKL